MCADIKSKCPACKKVIVYSEANPYRPFCSERCKLLDLGAWFDGAYSIAAEEDDSENSLPDEETSQ
jgi:hypothetical protein